MISFKQFLLEAKKVGKVIGGDHYVHKDYENHISDQEELNNPKSKKLITMGNVINTLPNQNVVHSVISQAKGMMRDDGVLVVNHPREPRYHEEDIPFHDILKSHFDSVEKSKGNVYVCKSPKR